MRVFALDVAGSCGGGQWAKCWTNLLPSNGLPVDVLDCENNWIQKVNDAAKGGAVLMLVHQNFCKDLIHSSAVKLLGGNNNINLMYVTGGKQSLVDEPCKPRIHYSRRIVPTGPDLGYLKAPLVTLCKALERAESDASKLKAAWDNWEAPLVAGLLAMLSPLSVHPDRSLADAIAAQIGKEMTVEQRLLAVWELDTNKPEERALITVLKDQNVTENGVFGWIEDHRTTFPALAGRYL